MTSAVLFDLDGTLLDIDVESFLQRYFSVLGPVVAGVLELAPEDQSGLRAVLAATETMSGLHPEQTNREAFEAHFHEITGVHLGAQEHATTLATFYSEVFPLLQETIGPHDGAAEVIETALGLGLKVAIATNPIFPMSAIRERMRWAGVEQLGVSVVTGYETMRATKPHGAYFLQTAEMLGVDPRECIMVGDDRSMDMPAADVGMRTFYVGAEPVPACDWSGSLRDLAGLLERLNG